MCRRKELALATNTRKVWTWALLDREDCVRVVRWKSNGGHSIN